jgi:serine/threonine protein phosphatase PrpC
MTSSKKVKFKLAARTDVGQVREHNEDNYVVCTNLGLKDWYYSSEEIEC